MDDTDAVTDIFNHFQGSSFSIVAVSEGAMSAKVAAKLRKAEGVLTGAEDKAAKKRAKEALKRVTIATVLGGVALLWCFWMLMLIGALEKWIDPMFGKSSVPNAHSINSLYVFKNEEVFKRFLAGNG